MLWRTNMTTLQSRKSGFTLIELTFAVAFISVLLITVSLITSEIINTYRKGYSMKAVNQVGRDLIEDFTDAVTSSPPANVSLTCAKFSDADDCVTDDAYKTIYQEFYAYIDVRNKNYNYDTKDVPFGGVFCTGKYSYVWNTGYALGTIYQNRKQLSVKFNDATLSNFRLLKFEDNSRSACIRSGNYSDLSTKSGSSYHYYDNLTLDLSSFYSADTSELISASDSSLALYDLTVFKPAQASTGGYLLYTASFILGTKEESINIMTSSDFCQAPVNYTADFSYCAVNKFNFTTQATGL